jgi:hypothetical protein
MSTIISTRNQSVTIRTRRGNITVGPAGAIDGLWRFCRRELRTNAEVLKLCGITNRRTLLRWRVHHGFPPPRLVFPARGGDLELWSRSDVEDWLADYRD